MNQQPGGYPPQQQQPGQYQPQQQQQQENLYVGSGKAVQTNFGMMMKLSFNAQDLQKLQQHLNDRGWVSLVLSKRQNPSQAGATHYMKIDTWQPNQAPQGGYQQQPQYQPQQQPGQYQPQQQPGQYQPQQQQYGQDNGGFGQGNQAQQQQPRYGAGDRPPQSTTNFNQPPYVPEDTEDDIPF